MTKYQYESGKTYLSESTPITVSRIPSGRYKINVVNGSNSSSLSFDTMVGTQKLYVSDGSGYGYVAVDIAINTADPVARCTYPETITVNGKTVANGCYGFTPASGADNGFAMNSWAGHSLITGIKPVSKKGNTWTDLSTNPTTWASNGSNEDYFTEFPFNWLSITNDGTKIRIIFSDKGTQPDSTFQCYAHVKGCDDYENSDIESAMSSANRASIIKTNGNSYFANAFHIGCFGASGSESGIYSKKASTYATSIKYANFFKGANARGDDYDCVSDQQWTYLQALFVLLYRSTDSQGAHSYGYANASSIDNGNTALSTTSYGMAGSSSSARNAVFWIHDTWGNISQYIGGLWNRAGDSSKLYYWLPRTANSRAFSNGWDAVTTAATQSSLGTDTGLTCSSTYGYVATVAGTNTGGFSPTSQSGGSGTTYFTDYGYVSYGSARFPRVGGIFNETDKAGLFCCNAEHLSLHSASSVGSRLSYRGGRT